MPTYRCRTLRPSPSNWFTVEALGWQEAANTFHEQWLDGVGGLRFREELPDGKSQIVVFALVEVEGHGLIISRVYSQGIWRKGGVKPLGQPTLGDIARELGWTHPVEELLTPWRGEESWEEASDRKWVEGAIKRWGKKD